MNALAAQLAAQFLVETGPIDALFTKELGHCILDQASEPLECVIQSNVLLFIYF